MEKKLTPKQKKFCDYYMKTGNATQSAIDAGYSRDTAYSIGSENLRKPEVMEYIKNKQKDYEINMNYQIESRQKALQKIFDDLISGELEVDTIDRYNMALKYSDQLNKMQGVYINKIDAKIEADNSKLDDIMSQLNGNGLDE